MLAKIRALNRATLVGETLRAALNSLAVVVPEWLQAFAPLEWHERYDHRVEESRRAIGQSGTHSPGRAR